MQCARPGCLGRLRVYSTFQLEAGALRHRSCPECGARFKTFEHRPKPPEVRGKGACAIYGAKP